MAGSDGLTGALPPEPGGLPHLESLELGAGKVIHLPPGICSASGGVVVLRKRI